MTSYSQSSISAFCNNLEKKIPLPLKSDNDADTRSVFMKCASQYYALIKEHDFMSSEQVKEIRRISEIINEAWLSYYKGDIQTAATKIKNLLTTRKIFCRPIRDYLTITIDRSHLGNNDHDSYYDQLGWQMQHLFKARLGTHKAFLIKDLTHIPFSQRDIVRHQRYSVAGLPCIYLGSSVYCCWIELDKPAFENINICRYQLIDKIILLDLTNTPTHIMSFKALDSGALNDLFLRMIVSFPIIMACSITSMTVGNGNAFRSDYLIPQLITSALIGKTGIDGIRYQSIKAQETATSGLACNYAIFPKMTKAYDQYWEGLSHLFAISTPVNMREAIDMLNADERIFLQIKASNHADGVTPPRWDREINLSQEQIVFGDNPVEYSRTPYGKVDHMLSVATAHTEIMGLVSR